MAASSTPVGSIKQDPMMETVYHWDTPLIIQSEMSIPLMEYSQIASDRLYFIDITNNAKINYGYIFNVNTYIPNGSIRVINSDNNLIGFTTFDFYENKVYVEISQEDKLTALMIVDSKNNLNKPNVTTFNCRVVSKLPQPVTLLAQLSYYNKILETQPSIYETLPRKIIFRYVIKPGENKISGYIVFDNS